MARPNDIYSMAYEDGGLTLDDLLAQIEQVSQPVYQPAPIYSPEPVYQPVYQPEPTYTPEPVYMAPQPVYQAPVSQPVSAMPSIEQIISQIQAPVQDMAVEDIKPVSKQTEAKPSSSVIDSLTQQILGQGTTDKWKGGVDAQTAAKDMAKIMAGIGITDINQFGKFTQGGIPTEVRPDGRGGFTDTKGNPVDPSIVKTETQSGEGGEFTYYTAPVGTQEVYGNKATGQVVPQTYGERQTGNAFGGTFEGKGNTGYRVDFTPDGKPVFYTTAASSRDDIGVFAPIIAAALTPVLGPAAASLLGTGASSLAVDALTGALVGGGTSAITGDSILKGALMGGAGGALANTVKPYLPSLPTPEVPIDFVNGTPEQINDVLRQNFVNDLKNAGVANPSEFLNNTGLNAAKFAAQGTEPIVTPITEPTVAPTVTPPIENVQVTAPVQPTVAPTIADVISSIVQQAPSPVEVTAPKEQVSPEILNAVNAQLTANVTPRVEVTAPKVEAPKVEAPKTVEQVISAIIPELVMTGQTPKKPEQPITPIIAPPIQPTLPEVTTIAERPSTITEETKPAPVIVAPPIETPLPPKTYTSSEIIDMIRLGLLGASVLGATQKDSGPTGFDIVPTPADWTSPVYQKDLPTTAATKLPPIDFGNRNLLIGTQWEKFLDPNYGKVPTPVQFNQPSNMSYDRLMGILGTGRDTLPSQVLSINDVISGIQNQYGQAPKGSMG